MVKTGKLKGLYLENKGIIQKRLKEFEKLIGESDERIFAELCFCILTPQSNARVCWDSITGLMDSRVLYTGDESEILKKIRRIRFNRTKAKRIVGARDFFTADGILQIKKIIKKFKSNIKTREFLVENITGIGYKESTHFLRNIGMGNGLAILDRHILRNLCELAIIAEIPQSISKKRYLEIENQMMEFSKRVGIPMEELDLLLWSKETGGVFK
jgi:N-glycosylase/DNA lyase